MKKALKIIVPIIIVLVLAGILYFTICHPRVKLWFDIQTIMDDAFVLNEFGTPLQPYDKYSVTNDSFVTVEYPNFSLQVPAYWEEQEREDTAMDTSTIVMYRPLGVTKENYGNSESLGFYPLSKDDSDMAILNVEGLSDSELSKLTNGYEQLGYGMPDNLYNTLIAANSLQEDDYSFWNYNKSLAYMYLLPYRNIYFFSDGITLQTYVYETEDVYALVNRRNADENGLYTFRIEVFDAEDLNTSYYLSIEVKNPETAYAIINSIEFHSS